MEKYYYFKDNWQGPFSLDELLRLQLEENIPIWYPGLCDNNMEIPEDCTHDKVNFAFVLNQFKKSEPLKKFYRTIIFSKTPLKGLYRYKDEFQIYPLNLKNAPNQSNVSDIPLIIEFWYDTKDNAKVTVFDYQNLNEWASEASTQLNRLIQITNLLSVISNYRFFYYRVVDAKWTKYFPDDVNDSNRDEINNSPSQWSLVNYYYPGISEDLQISEFAKPDFPQVKFYEQNFYYYYNPVENIQKPITLPHTINLILERYFSLNNKERNVVDSAIYQICNALDLFSTMKSLSFFSAVSSIETLVNYEFRDEILEYECDQCKSLKSSSRICQKCGKPTWGVGAKFREFLFKYVSKQKDAKKFYNSIYDIRSKITHTEYLLHGENFMSFDLTDKTKEINLRHLEAIQLSRRSLVNWLLKKDT